MHRAKLLRSTPIRFALTYGLLFVFTSLAVWLVSFELLRRELHRTLDASIAETYTVLASTYAPDDVEDLVSTMNSSAKLSTDSARVFALADPDGKLLSGNLAAVPPADGFATLSAPELGMPGTGQFRMLSGSIGGYRMAVGQSFEETGDLLRIVLVSFGWASALAVLLAFATGTYLARRAQQRLDVIAATMAAVSDGKLDVRIPLTGSGDDIDAVSSHINQALERLSTLVESMRQVSTDIAHDLKTPLNRLKLMVDEALDHSATDLVLQPLLDEALAECDRINATFDALLRISQIEAGARKLHFRPLDLSALLLDVVETYADVAEDNGQRLAAGRIEAADVHGDKDLLTQMLVNLIENAITHCPAGTEIAVTLTHDTAGLSLTVVDNGPGIPEGEREKVFRRLYRLDKSRSTAGSGLGLSLVRAIADLHGARVAIGDNRPGTRVTLTFSPAGEDGAAATGRRA